jgi:hypothetical protein
MAGRAGGVCRQLGDDGFVLFSQRGDGDGLFFHGLLQGIQGGDVFLQFALIGGQRLDSGGLVSELGGIGFALDGQQFLDAGEEGRAAFFFQFQGEFDGFGKQVVRVQLALASGLFSALALNCSISVPRLAGSSVTARPTR